MSYYVGRNSSSERANVESSSRRSLTPQPTRDIFTCHGQPPGEAGEAQMHSFMNKYLLSIYLRWHNSEQARHSFNEASSPVGETASDQNRIICFSRRCVF